MNLKYIEQPKEGYIKIRKQIKGKLYNFGSYKSLEKAIEMRDYFQTKGWENCLDERLKYSTKPKYWTTTRTGKYIPQKRINGEIVYGCTCNSIEEVENEVELLEKCGWDYDALCESIDDTCDGKIMFKNRIVGEV